MQKRIIACWLVLAAVSLPRLARAQAPTAQAPTDTSTLSVSVEKLRAGGPAVAQAMRPLPSATPLQPGDEVHYRLRFTNTTRGAVQRVVFSNPIPAGLRFLPGSADADREDVRVEYSIDAGKTWSVEPMVDVIENGQLVRRPAPPERITDVRWTVTGWIQPRGRVSTGFRARFLAVDGSARRGTQ